MRGLFCPCKKKESDLSYPKEDKAIGKSSPGSISLFALAYKMNSDSIGRRTNNMDFLVLCLLVILAIIHEIKEKND